MTDSAIRWKGDGDAEWLATFIRERWAGEPLIVHGAEYRLSECPALIYGEREGVAVFTLDPEPPELLLLHALRSGAGVGTALISAVAGAARNRGHDRLLVTTTNDNTAALRFYQRRGFRLNEVRFGAVDQARLRKPSIPDVGFDGIPLHDEIDLVLTL